MYQKKNYEPSDQRNIIPLFQPIVSPQSISIPNNPFNSLMSSNQSFNLHDHDSFQYPNNTEENLNLHYNHSEKNVGIPSIIDNDLQLQHHKSDSFLYVYNPFINIDYIPITSSKTNNQSMTKLLEHKRDRVLKSNSNSLQSTDIDNNNKGIAFSKQYELIDCNYGKDKRKNKKRKDKNIKRNTAGNECNNDIDKRGVHHEKNDDSLYKNKDQSKCNSNNNNTNDYNDTTINNNNNRKRSNHLPTELELYKDDKYTIDLQNILNSNIKHKFMYENFPNAYTKIELLKNILKLKKKSIEGKIYIQSNDFRKDNTFLVNPFECEFSLKKIPRIIWTPIDSMNDSDYNTFYNKLEQKWPFSKCPCVSEYILEFLMMNDYSQDKCFMELEKCVEFVNERITNVMKTVTENTTKIQRGSQYCLRNRKGGK